MSDREAKRKGAMLAIAIGGVMVVIGYELVTSGSRTMWRAGKELAKR